MDNKQIKELMATMERTGVSEITVEEEKGDIKFKLHLKREQFATGRAMMDSEDENLLRENTLRRAASTLPNHLEMAPLGSGSSGAAQASTPQPKEEIPSLYITSRMVGTFYASPSPDDSAFIKVGDKIEKETVVCIIEAMKVMNEIKAGVAGTVVEVLVETGQPVEFGSKLFKLI